MISIANHSAKREVQQLALAVFPSVSQKQIIIRLASKPIPAPAKRPFRWVRWPAFSRNGSPKDM